ncbi:DUF4238 domain-containing protein [Streptomyces sp. NPDC088341]|uniref:DUF4238 domain-containing protein n=1 Tax=Streptomyces sp. NPDC088341 TaxID=3154870 RepID=UPI003430499F
MGRASTAKRQARETGQTRDHTVPQMYLRQFAEHRGRRHYELTVRRIGKADEPFRAMTNKVFAVNGYYWGTTPDGVPHHAVEDLFTQLEGAAASVMRAVLDNPDGALTGRWPLDAEERLHLAWWMAAQILRTTRQRKRLEYADRSTERLEVPDDVAAITANNPHLHYIVEHLAALAFTLFARPWGLAFTQMCLLTSDVPVVLCNVPDADDQLAAAAHADILLPLDPHRLLFLPGTGMRARDPRKRTDHRSLIPGGVGMALVQVAYDWPTPSSPTTPGTTPGTTGNPPGHATPLPGTETASRRRPTPSTTTYWLPI